MTADRIKTITSFWRDAGSKRWFATDPAFDAEFRTRFLELHLAAARREQFQRNAFRGTPHMYGTDRLARLLVGRALDAGVDRDIEPDLRVFLHLPFSHSEDLGDQARGFPHRNALLGRESTAEERAFLEGGGFGG